MGKFNNFYYKILHRRPQLLCYLIAKFERLLFSLFPKTGTNSKVGQRTNRILKENLKSGHTNVFGHSHHADFDLANNFINTGSIMCRHASYLLIDDQELRLEKTRY